MKRIDWEKLTKRRALGIGVMALGAIVTFAPVFFGGCIALLGIALVAAGLLQFIGTFRSDDEAKSLLSYVAGSKVNFCNR